MDKKTRALYMTMFKDYPDVLDIEQVSHILNISTKTTYKIIKSGALRPSEEVLQVCHDCGEE